MAIVLFNLQILGQYFAVLRPLTSKLAAEVGFQLLDIFLLFGAPHILQSDRMDCISTKSTCPRLKILAKKWFED
jgi:hypothetical protein